MTHCQSWDIDKYKSDHEPKHHWALKKKFIEFHKDRFPENELVSRHTTVLLLTRLEAPSRVLLPSLTPVPRNWVLGIKV